MNAAKSKTQGRAGLSEPAVESRPRSLASEYIEGFQVGDLVEWTFTKKIFPELPKTIMRVLGRGTKPGAIRVEYVDQDHNTPWNSFNAYPVELVPVEPDEALKALAGSWRVYVGQPVPGLLTQSRA